MLTKLDRKPISDMFTEIHHSLWQVRLTVIPWVILSPSLPLANQLSTTSWIRRDWNTKSFIQMCYGNWGIQVVQNGYFEIVVLENSSQVFDSDPYESPRPWPPLQVPVTYYRGDFPARRLPSNVLKIVYYFATSVLVHYKTYNRGDILWLLQLVNCTLYSVQQHNWGKNGRALSTYNREETSASQPSSYVFRAWKRFPLPSHPRIKRLSFDRAKGIGFVI